MTELSKEVHVQRNQELLSRLSPLDAPKRHYDIRTKRLLNSGMWAIRHTEFLEWSSESAKARTLCCYGDPGAGKTFIASIIIDELDSRIESSNIGLAYIYCDYQDEHRQTAENIFGEILKQLIKGLPDIPEPIEKELHRNGKPFGLDEAMKMFHEVCKLFDRTYVCLDATDECQHLDRLLDSLQKAPPSVYLFCTGRSHIQHIIRKHFLRSYEIVVKAEESDIKLLIEERINNDCKINPEIIDEELKQRITEKISDLSKGIFLLPVLHIGTVLEQRSKRDRRDALETLSHGLEKAFENTIDRILHQSKPLVSQARKLLTWIHLAERPLTVDELLEALAIREGDNELDRSGLLGRATLLDCCLGLATIDTETSTVRLVHFSLREYLEKKDEILGQQIVDGHTLIARTCLTCLMFSSVTEDISPQSTTDSEDEESMIHSKYVVSVHN